jgi:hypothetical protein
VNTKLDQLLADSLALWQVDGTVERGTLPVVAVIRSVTCTVFIERAAADAPWRWFVRRRDARMCEERARPCASLVGLLNELRGALGVERGNAVRIAPSPAA